MLSVTSSGGLLARAFAFYALRHASPRAQTGRHR